MARIKMTAAVHRRISKRELLAALRNAGLPLLVHRNRAYFIGTDSRARQFENILAASLTRPPETLSQLVRCEPSVS
jgi:hypothetical protein